MKKFDAFSKRLEVLLRAEKNNLRDEFYRAGVIGHFNLTFEMAWKATKETLQLYGVDVAKTGSPREILKAAYQINFLHDEKIWLDMLKNRNTVAHVYDENAAVALSEKIFVNYIPALKNLRDLLEEKNSAVEKSGDVF